MPATQAGFGLIIGGVRTGALAAHTTRRRDWCRAVGACGPRRGRGDGLRSGGCSSGRTGCSRGRNSPRIENAGELYTPCCRRMEWFQSRRSNLRLRRREARSPRVSLSQQSSANNQGSDCKRCTRPIFPRPSPAQPGEQTLTRQNGRQGLSQNPQTEEGKTHHQHQHRQLAEHGLPARGPDSQGHPMGDPDGQDVSEQYQRQL